MTYFNFTPAHLEKGFTFPIYPFDFHSHFIGILPLESDVKVKKSIEVNVSDGDRLTQLILFKGMPLSLLNLMKTNQDVESDLDAHYELFSLALGLMNKKEKNPFSSPFLNTSNASQYINYLQGECVAESLYIACVLMLRNLGLEQNHAIGESQLYDITSDLLKSKALRIQTNDQIVSYINRKIYQANKYTPFDDVYWVREAICKSDKYKHMFDIMTLEYLKAIGVTHAQIALGVDELKKIDHLISINSDKKYDGYKLLAHTTHAHNDADFSQEMNEIIELFEAETYKQLVGVDLLASEERLGQYKDVFDILLKNQKVFNNNRKVSGIKKTVVHIHCGKGNGVNDNNRSFTGYYLRNASSIYPAKFYQEMNNYIWRCYQNTLLAAPARKQELAVQGRKEKTYLAVSGLFDELFFYNALVINGLKIKRFDVSGSDSQQQVQYSSRINIAYLCQVLDRKVRDLDKTYYQAICQNTVFPFSIRISHVSQERHYVSRKFPEVMHDTNLRGNFITSASGLFNSAHVYRLNNGFRYLNGQIDTDLLNTTINYIAPVGRQYFTDEQLFNLHKLRERIKVYTSNKGDIRLDNAKGYAHLIHAILSENILFKAADTDAFEQGINHVIDKLGQNKNVSELIKLVRIVATECSKEKNQSLSHIVGNMFALVVIGYLITVLQNSGKSVLDNNSYIVDPADASLFYNFFSALLNWHSYLLGSDGQGVEHMQMDYEIGRMALIISYSVFENESLVIDIFVPLFSRYIFEVSRQHWLDIMGKNVTFNDGVLQLKQFEGFKSNHSIVFVKTS